MRHVTINNDKLKKILNDLTETVAEIQAKYSELQEIDKEIKVMASKRERLLDKAKSHVDEKSLGMGQYEILTRILLQDGEPTVEIVDQVEEYKKMLDEKNAENK